MNWIDVILLIIIIACVAIGFWRGLVFSVLSLFSNFVNFVLALFLTKPVSYLFNSWFHLDGALTKAFAKHIAGMGEGFSTNLVGMSSAEISSHVSSTLKSSKFPFRHLFQNMLKMDGNAIANKESLTLNDILSKSFGSFFSFVISFIVIFLLILLVLFLIGLISKKAKQVDGIRITDRILGVVFGLVNGAIVIAFIFAILSFFKEDGLLAPLFDYINKSAIGSWAYSNVNYLVDKYINFKTIINAVQGFSVAVKL